MNAWERCRVIGTGLVSVGLIMQSSPIAWAQVDPAIMERDPVLATTIEAATRADPDFQKDPELRMTVEQLTKDCLTDPRTRAEIASEVGRVRAEGGAERVISKEVLTAVRAEASTTFAIREADIRKALEALPAHSTERKMAELNIEHGKQVMEAYAKGEAPPPPPREMVAHAQEMFKEWTEKSGASQREIEMAKFAMERFAGGERMGPMGPGGMAPGPGHEMGPPSDQQLKTMADAGQISPEQLKQMQKDKAVWETAANDPAAREALMQKYASEGMHQGFEAMQRGGFEMMPRGGFEALGPGGVEAHGPGPGGWEAMGNQYVREALATGGVPTEQQVREYIQTEIRQDIQQQQQQQYQNQQQIQAEVKVREYHHLHEGGFDHIHEVFRHPDGTCHDHGTMQPSSC